MKNKYILTGSICLFISIFSNHVQAKENIKITIPNFNVSINNNKIDVKNSQYPPIVYKDITYFPMTYYDMRLLGVETDWKGDKEGLFIEKSSINGSYVPVLNEQNSKNYYATISNFPITINNKKIDNSKEEYPLLNFRDVTYFPLTWKFAVDEFGWKYNFDSKNGLVITSNDNTLTSDIVIDSDNVIVNAPYYYFTKGYDLFAGELNSKNAPKKIFQIPKDSKMFSLNTFGDSPYLSYKDINASTRSPYYYVYLDGYSAKNVEEPYNNKYEIFLPGNALRIKKNNNFIDIELGENYVMSVCEINNVFFVIGENQANKKVTLFYIDENNLLVPINELGKNANYFQWDRDNLYYVIDNSIVCQNINTKNITEVQKLNPNISSGDSIIYNVLNSHIFYRNNMENYSLYMDNKPMNGSAQISNLSIINNYFVATFEEKPENKYRLMVIDKNGNIVYKSADIAAYNSISIKDNTLYYFNLYSKKIVSNKLK